MFNRYTSFLSLVCPTKNIYLHQADDKRNLFCIIFFFRCAKNFPSYFYSLGIVYDRLSLTNRVITIFCWMLWNALTQINDRWQTFTEVNTTVDLVFQHNQRLICYRLKMYIIFLYLFIKNVAISLKVLFIWVISRTHNIQKKKSHDMNFIFLGGG